MWGEHVSHIFAGSRYSLSILHWVGHVCKPHKRSGVGPLCKCFYCSNVTLIGFSVCVSLELSRSRNGISSCFSIFSPYIVYVCGVVQVKSDVVSARELFINNHNLCWESEVELTNLFVLYEIYFPHGGSELHNNNTSSGWNTSEHRWSRKKLRVEKSTRAHRIVDETENFTRQNSQTRLASLSRSSGSSKKHYFMKT